jgi:signal transduction histidine kinase
MEKPTIAELRTNIAVRDLPDEHLQWILDRSEVKEYEDGTQIFKLGDPIDVMWFLIEGKATFYMDVNGRQVHYFTFENDEQTGGVGGVLPYSRLKTSPGYSYAVGTMRVVQLHKEHFHDLEQLNPDFIQRLVAYMTERARYFATQKLQQEKVSALGQLAAGIAHELNNPASAINRIASEMNRRLDQNYEQTESLLTLQINPDHLAYIHGLVALKKDELKKTKLSAMKRIEKEDEIGDWLERNNFKGHNLNIDTFIDFGFSVDDFDAIKGNIGTDAFLHVLAWVENILISQRLIRDLDDASCRISNLVGAIKSHVHMDRTNEKQPTNVHKDIDNALTLLGYKLRDKNIKVTKKYCTDLREVPAYVGELNQVWTNIIDNSIYAMEKGGELCIETTSNAKDVKVKIIDNGKGIKPEIMSRIFDPFFTTKKVGEGTGIGLDLVSRILKRHDGEVKVNSVPGRTEFVVCIPMHAKEEAVPKEVKA